MSYDAFTIAATMPVALTPEQTQKRIKSILAPEINELLIYMETGDREPLSNFMEQLLIGALCHLDGEDPEDDTFEQVERTLSEYYEICNGPEPNSCRINFAGNTESEDPLGPTCPNLVEQFLLVRRGFVLVSYVNLNSAWGNWRFIPYSKQGEVIQGRRLHTTSRPKRSATPQARRSPFVSIR